MPTLTLSSYVTNGLYPNLPNYAPLLTMGSPVLLNPTPQFNPSEDPSKFGLAVQRLGLTPQQLTDLQSIATIRSTNGQIIVPTTTGFVQVGEGRTLEFDPNTLQGRITPALATNVNPQFGPQAFDSPTQIYTGADCRLMIECADPTSDGRRYAKQLLEATTITVSIFREVSPVRAAGYINPKGFALGKRTIAGTLILTQGTLDVFVEFLQSVVVADSSKDTYFTKLDQLPPFNITMVFTNEAGYASQRTLLGVKFVSDGTVYSIQDMMVEQSLSFMATDFTLLLPFTLPGLYQPASLLDPTSSREKIPLDLMVQF